METRSEMQSPHTKVTSQLSQPKQSQINSICRKDDICRTTKVISLYRSHTLSSKDDLNNAIPVM